MPDALTKIVEEFEAQALGPAEPVATRPDARLIDGATFALDVPDVPPVVWGRGGRCFGPRVSRSCTGLDGTGKTTLAQRIVLARCGIGSGLVLGYPVEASSRKVLYVAADRPEQALVFDPSHGQRGRPRGWSDRLIFGVVHRRSTS